MSVLTGPSDGQFTTIQFGQVSGGLVSTVEDSLGVLVSGRYLLMKRGLDILVSLALLIVLTPVLVAIALVVVLDSRGPVLFRQTRVGQNGGHFAMLKFRTMRAERRQRDGGPPGGALERRRRHKSVGDPRVTRVGRMLRRTCLDELPQLWNVLLGDMSLVGPRPELPSIVETYEPWQHLRHVVAPGITGWWQVNRARDQLMHEATELDLYYVRNHSLLLDLRIMARTLGAIIDGRGAY